MGIKDWFTKKPEELPPQPLKKVDLPKRDPEVEKLLNDSVEKLNVIKVILAPLEEREDELQKQFAPIRYDLRAICKEISKIKKETDFHTLNNLVMKLQ